MLKFLMCRAVPLMCAWLAAAPAAQASQENTPAAPAQPALASPFDQYRNFRDEQVQDWRKSNDRVREIGGWRTYLRESYEGGNSAGQPHQH